MRLRSIISRFAVCVLTLWGLGLVGVAPRAWSQTSGPDSAAKPPYNIIFIISDQEADHLLVTGEFDASAKGIRLSQSLRCGSNVHTIASRVHQWPAPSGQR